jgi:excisionase family DNA binding protein
MSAAQRDLTLAEVAELRRFTPRYLRELIRRHQIPVLRSGRLIRFDALSLCALEEALRQPCRSLLSDENPPERSRLAAPWRANAYAAALKATTPNSQRKKLPRSKPIFSERRGMANVVVLDPLPKRP